MSGNLIKAPLLNHLLLMHFIPHENIRKPLITKKFSSVHA